MASEIVQDADAALTAELERNIIEEARPAMAAYQHCIIKSIESSPTMADKFTLMPAGSSMLGGAITDGTAMSNTAINPTSVTVTAAGVGLLGLVTDFSKLGSTLDMAAVGGAFGRGVQEKIDTDVTATFSGFTTNTTVGTSGASLTLGNVQTAQYELQLAKAPGPYVLVVHTGGANHLRQAVAASSSSIWANPQQGLGALAVLGKDAFVGNLFGVDIFQSPTNPTSGGDSYSLMFSKGEAASNKGAIGFVWKWQPKIETLRQPQYPGEYLAVTTAYGVAKIVGAYGVRFQTSTT